MSDPVHDEEGSPIAPTGGPPSRPWWRTGAAAAATLGLVGAITAAVIGLRPWESPAPRLEVVSVEVTDGASDPTSAAVDPMTLDIRLRNIGGQVSVLHRLDMEVLDVGALGVCEGGAALEPTATYEAVLPATARPGDVIQVPISHSLEPNTADRIAVRIFPSEKPAEWLFDIVLAQLELMLFHDREEAPVDAGRAVVATPWAPDASWFSEELVADIDAQVAAGDPVDPMTREVIECYRSNGALFDRIAAHEGERVPKLEPAAVSDA